MENRTHVLQLPAFQGLPRREAAVLRRHLDHARLPAGQSVLLGPGPAEELLIVVEGRLQALGWDGWVARPGEVLGARALLIRRPQLHGFRAVGPALVAYAGLRQARTLMSGSPAFATSVAVSLCDELARRDVAAPQR